MDFRSPLKELESIQDNNSYHQMIGAIKFLANFIGRYKFEYSPTETCLNMIALQSEEKRRRSANSESMKMNQKVILFLVKKE